MDKLQFWKTIDMSLQTSPSWDEEAAAEKIYKQLLHYSPENILKYNEILGQLIMEADNYNVLAGFLIIEGISKNASKDFYISDDSYLSFRMWLVFQGEKVYSETMKNADYLANIINPGDSPYFELIAGTAMRAYFEKAKTDTFPQPSKAYNNEDYTKGARTPVNELPMKYPALWKKFL